VLRHRILVVVFWLGLTVFGGYSAQRVSDRWLESFSIPGYSAYEANQRLVRDFGNGEQAPLVAVVHARKGGDVTKIAGVRELLAAAAAENPGARYSDYFTTGSTMYVSRDRSTTFAEIFPAGQQGFQGVPTIAATRAALHGAPPNGVETFLTGRDVLQDESSGGDNGAPSVLFEALIGGVGALIILLFVFGTLPAVAMPLLVAVASILNTFTLVWLLTYVTSVSIVVQFLIALVGLGVAIDYALLMIFRFREELRHGEDVETAIVETMRHAGRSVIVSGSTVAVGLLSMVVIPLPFIRSIGFGGMLIPAVSVLAAITLLPAMLSMLGHRVNSVRVMPRRIVEGTDREEGFWHRWAGLVTRRAPLTAAIGALIVAALLVPGLQLNPSEAQAKDLPGAGEAHRGYATLRSAGISAGALKPLELLVEGQGAGAAAPTIARRVAETPGIVGASAPASWRRDDTALVEAIPVADGAAKSTNRLISRLQEHVVPQIAAESGVRVTLAGVSPEDRDFVHAVYSKFPYVLLFVVLLTYVLLARAFKSLVLPLKAVILNLVSLGAAFGIVVFIFQWGNGSEAIWGVPSTNAIISWIPLMIFAFLYGLSMDYEVFMLTRIREEYDKSGDTTHAIAYGLARTGKLVTSAALVLALAFFVLSTSPGTDVKQFGIGLAAGIIFDATIIRALLVPSLMRLFGRWNWWLPRPAARVLFVRTPAPGSA
jgi:RND superfamily putative drug exporter